MDEAHFYYMLDIKYVKRKISSLSVTMSKHIG
jgi:hypothetical protein